MTDVCLTLTLLWAALNLRGGCFSSTSAEQFSSAANFSSNSETRKAEYVNWMRRLLLHFNGFVWSSENMWADCFFWCYFANDNKKRKERGMDPRRQNEAILTFWLILFTPKWETTQLQHSKDVTTTKYLQDCPVLPNTSTQINLCAKVFYPAASQQHLFSLFSLLHCLTKPLPFLSPFDCHFTLGHVSPTGSVGDVDWFLICYDQITVNPLKWVTNFYIAPSRHNRKWEPIRITAHCIALHHADVPRSSIQWV